MRTAGLATVTFALVCAATDAAALTPISGLTQVQADVFVSDGAVANGGASTSSWAATPTDIAASIDKGVLVQGPLQHRANAHAFNQATWTADGSAGQVHLDWGWYFGDEVDGLMGASFTALNPVWSYTFKADHDGLLIWEGQIAPGSTGQVANSTFGLSGWNLQLNGVTVIDLLDPTGGKLRYGDRDFALTAGEVYTFSLTNVSNIAGSNFGADYRGRMKGDFYWQIFEEPAAVPEPAAWALLLLGFGTAGAALRHRRALAT